ncbi:MAG: lysine biosynthesis protein LysW [Halobacteria archaeon]|nr:lysine biosynthesis protein LysW [Halobacteria archaeon]
MTQKVECPVCGAEVEPEWEVERGEIIDCTECGAELEVADTDPLDLIEAPELEEDWGE